MFILEESFDKFEHVMPNITFNVFFIFCINISMWHFFRISDDLCIAN